MISRIDGELVGVADGRVELRCGAITYALLIPASDEEHLAGRVGQRICFHAHQYLESQGQGASFVPRLLGFASADARAFFELMTTVKGLGARKALRALRLPYPAVAAAIARKDIALLITLPEIGRRTAETMVAELHGKVDVFMEPGRDEDLPAGGVSPGVVVQDALAALTQLGEPKMHARRLIERALADDPTLDTADALVSAAYRVRATVQGGTE